MLDVTQAPYSQVLNDSNDNTTGIQQALNDAGALATGDRRVLVPGTARISVPLVVPPFVSLEGTHAARNDTPSQPGKIRATAGFTGSAMVKFLDQTTGGYSVISFGQRLLNITLDGSLAYAGAQVYSGVRADGVVRGVRLDNVTVQNVTDRGIHVASANGGNPYSWHCDNVQVLAAKVDGFRLPTMTDGTFINSRAIGCGRHGWYIDGCANSTFTNCRAEWNTQNGWNLDGGWGTGTGSGGTLFTNCSTDRNGFNGFLVKATGNPPLRFSNIMTRRDGRNGGAGGAGYAGFRVDGATCPIIIDGITCFPGVDDDGANAASPQYGLRVNGATWVDVGSGYLHAVSGAVSDLGGNTYFNVSSRVGRATGPTSAPVRQYVPGGV